MLRPLAIPHSAAAAPISTQAKVYDSLGRQHTVNLTFTRTGGDSWTLGVQVPDDIANAALFLCSDEAERADAWAQAEARLQKIFRAAALCQPAMAGLYGAVRAFRRS